MRTRFYLASLASLALLATVSARAQDPVKPSSTTAAQKSRTARGPLPDPVLLDGSNQQPEKKPDYGMLGQFEMPGDDNAPQGGKVGGQSQPPGSPQGGGQQNAAQQGAMSAGGASGAQAQNGGGAAGGAQQQQGGGAGGAQQQGGAGGQQGGQPGGPGGAGDAVAQNDPNAKADGMQVTSLGGDPSGGGAVAGGAQKPQQIALGDPAMRIKPAPGASSAIGAAAGLSNSTQQMESKIGKGSGPGPANGIDGKGGVEKGRVMPAGL